MRLDPGTSFGTVNAVATDLVEVPETATYRSADGTQVRRYRAGDRVSRQEYELLQMAPVEIAGEVAVDPASEIPGEVLTIDGQPAEGVQLESPPPPEWAADLPVQDLPDPDAKAEPAPENKAEKPPKTKDA